MVRLPLLLVATALVATSLAAGEGANVQSWCPPNISDLVLKPVPASTTAYIQAATARVQADFGPNMSLLEALLCADESCSTAAPSIVDWRWSRLVFQLRASLNNVAAYGSVQGDGSLRVRFECHLDPFTEDDARARWPPADVTFESAFQVVKKHYPDTQFVASVWRRPLHYCVTEDLLIFNAAYFVGVSSHKICRSFATQTNQTGCRQDCIPALSTVMV